MSPTRTIIRPNQLDFFPRERRPLQHNPRRNTSFYSFVKRTSPSPPTPENEKPTPYAVLVPSWLQRCTSWIREYVTSGYDDVQEDYMMSGGLMGYETRYRYDERRGRDGELWEGYPAYESVEGRMVELGLS